MKLLAVVLASPGFAAPLHAQTGDLDSLNDHFANERSVASAAAHARAAALLRQPGKEDAAARVCFEGHDNMALEGAQTYYEAALSIASERERADWQRADVATKREWLKQQRVTKAVLPGGTVRELPPINVK